MISTRWSVLQRDLTSGFFLAFLSPSLRYCRKMCKTYHWDFDLNVTGRVCTLMMGFLFEYIFGVADGAGDNCGNRKLPLQRNRTKWARCVCCQEVNRMYQSGFNEHDPILGISGSPGFNGYYGRDSARGDGTSSDTVDWSGQASLVLEQFVRFGVSGYPTPFPKLGCDWVRQPDHEMFSWCCRRVKSHRPSLSVVMCPGQVVRAWWMAWGMMQKKIGEIAGIFKKFQIIHSPEWCCWCCCCSIYWSLPTLPVAKAENSEISTVVGKIGLCQELWTWSRLGRCRLWRWRNWLTYCWWLKYKTWWRL